MTTDTPAVADNAKGTTIWAFLSRKVDLMVNEDASGDLPRDEPKGQFGWNIGLEFGTFDHLSKLLTSEYDLPKRFCGNLFFRCGPIKPGQVKTLAIQAHGAPGVVDMDGVSASAADVTPLLQQNPNFLNVVTIQGKFAPQIAAIRNVLRPDGGVFFMGCNVASGTAGTEFLLAMSRALPGRKIGAITSVGYSDMARQKCASSSGFSDYPGMRDTQYTSHKVSGSPQRDYEKLSVWNDLQRLPWADWNSIHAKVASNGVLVRDAPEPPLYPVL